AILIDRLEHGSQADIKSAIWALARRHDGVQRVLRLADDPRPWIEEELLGAIAEVSAPLTDEQLGDLAKKTRSRAFDRLRERHLARTRRGAPEKGPDQRIQYVERASESPAGARLPAEPVARNAAQPSPK